MYSHYIPGMERDGGSRPIASRSMTLASGCRLVRRSVHSSLLLLLFCAGLFGEGNSSISVAAHRALEQGDYSSAERLYRKVLQNSRSFEALSNVGIALYLQGKTSDAIGYFEAALKQRYDVGTFALLAAARCGTRDVEAARPMLTKIAVQSIRDSRVLALMAPCFLEAGDPVEAIKTYEALQNSVQFAGDELLIRLAHAYLAATRFFFERLQKAQQSEDFVRIMQEARDSGSMNARAGFAAAVQQWPFLRSDMSFQEAVDLWRKHPENAGLLYMLAVLSGEQAMKQVLRCEEHYSDSPWLEQFRAEMLASQGREDDAKSIYERLMQRRPDLPQLRRDLAALYRRNGEWQNALVLFQQEESANENDEHAAASVSECLLQLGKYVELRDYLHPRMRRRSVPLWARLDLSAANQKLGNSEAAITLLVAAEKEHPSSKTVHYKLMRLYSTTGKTAAAGREKRQFESSHE